MPPDGYSIPEKYRPIAEALAADMGITVHAALRHLDEGSPLREAVDTALQQAFESGSSPAVSILLAEISQHIGGTPKSYATGYQDGLQRAVELLSEEMAARYTQAFRTGVKVGREQMAIEQAQAAP